jgi:voltage-gated potassium channel
MKEQAAAAAAMQPWITYSARFVRRVSVGRSHDRRNDEVERLERQLVLRRAAIAGVAFLCLLGIGTLLFALAGNESGEEAFYRALGAFTTANIVSEPDTTRERAISAALTVAGGLFYLALVGSVLQVILLRTAVAETWRERRARKELKKLRAHYIVCGFGRVGRAVVDALLRAGKDVVVVEYKPENARAATELGAVAVVGDADDMEVLKQAGVARAEALIATVGTDAENVYIALAARRCNQNLFIAARASDDDAKRNLAEVMNHVSTPYTSAGRELAEAVMSRRAGNSALRAPEQQGRNG